MANLSKIKLPNNQTYDLRDSNLNGHTVNADVPANAQFTDTTYEEATTSTSGLMSATDKQTVNALGNVSTLTYTILKTF